jgi:hypothetical protein
MRNLAILFVHIMATLARLLGPGGVRSVVAESVLVKQQLLILNRSRQRSPNLRFSDRLVAGLCALLLRPERLIRSAIILKPSTLFSLHQALRNRKYRLLFSSERKGKPGPKGPSKELIDAVVQMKQFNPTWGCPRIAQQIAFGWDRARARQLVGGGLPSSPFRLRSGFTIPPRSRFPRPPDNPGRPVCPGPVRNRGLSAMSLPTGSEI